MDPQAVKSIVYLLSLRPIRRPRDRSAKLCAAAELMVRRLEQKCDALAASVQALFKEGTFTPVELGRVRRAICHVETQARRNQAQVPLLEKELDRDSFEVYSALHVDSEYALADCAELRTALAAELQPICDPGLRAYAEVQIQAWSPSLQEWDLKPEPAESVTEFVERVVREAEQGESDSMVEAHEALLVALEEAKTVTPETPSQAWDWAAHHVIGGIVQAQATVKDVLCKFESVNDRLGLSGNLRRCYSQLLGWLDWDQSHLYALSQAQASSCVPPEIWEFEILHADIFSNTRWLVHEELKLVKTTRDHLIALSELVANARGFTKPNELANVLKLTRDRSGMRHTALALVLASEKAQRDGHRDPVRICLAKQLEYGASLLANGLEVGGKEAELDRLTQRRLDSDLDKFVSKALAVKTSELRAHLLFAAYLRRVQEEDQDLDVEPAAKNWILDVGGTVCDRGCRAPVIAMRRVFLNYDVKLQPSQIVQDMGLGKRQHLELLLERYPPCVPRDAQQVHEDFSSELLKVLQTEPELCRLFEPLPALFRDLQSKGHKVMHTTGYTRAQISPILEFWRQQQDYMPDLVICSDEAAPRPDPEAIERALRTVRRCSSPDSLAAEKRRTIKIDDTEVGLQEGINAGVWKSCGVVDTGAWLSGLDAAAGNELEVARWEQHQKLAFTNFVYRTTEECITGWRNANTAIEH
jgi:phosphonoacetaldehyde hydrolase